ncbi:MAG: hypothetical protein HY721_33885 [Planctomycetes bacterium]|nr:hypothetical protein [Planctomycetota bacterium]
MIGRARARRRAAALALWALAAAAASCAGRRDPGRDRDRDDPADSRDGDREKRLWSPFEIAFLAPNQILEPKDDVRGLRLTLIYGVHRDVYGLGLAGGADRATGRAAGAQLAWGVSATGGETAGLQWAGLVSHCGARFAGVQFAGVWSSAGVPFRGSSEGNGRLTGLQLAGLVSRGSVTGAQVSGVANAASSVALGLSEGVQAAMGVNLARSVAGVQLAGGLNKASRSLHGVQLAFAANACGGGAGAQVGLINIVENGESRAAWSGLQLGLINSAHEGTGVQIGLLNFNRAGWVPFFPLVHFGWGAPTPALRAGSSSRRSSGIARSFEG